jgi:hypothetical protein
MDYTKALSREQSNEFIMMARKRKILVFDNACVGNDNVIQFNIWIDGRSLCEIL